ncbi:MAG: hypothetical protein AW09_000031 [Candidatus Accumulibacter phosphatis]|jgi:hypothetical protein|uniref:Uncharacterized protein n=1 Tax=Candidatus Accumulibacter phosphatis TaxID=327160 RepID=A0A080M0D8_9PROT|nr:MAG: hypothetical protein AW09_000031 [Candidatus Accumulibacter phosphatis]
MSILNDPNFMPLTRDEIVFSCVFTYLSEDEEMQLKRSIACDMEYRRVRWENGVEALMAMSSNQPLLTNEQLVEAYCAAIGQLLFGHRREAESK